MEEAERIAREEHGSIKLAVISGRYFTFCSVSLPLPQVSGGFPGIDPHFIELGFLTRTSPHSVLFRCRHTRLLPKAGI